MEPVKIETQPGTRNDYLRIESYITDRTGEWFWLEVMQDRTSATDQEISLVKYSVSMNRAGLINLLNGAAQALGESR